MKNEKEEAIFIYFFLACDEGYPLSALGCTFWRAVSHETIAPRRMPTHKIPRQVQSWFWLSSPLAPAWSILYVTPLWIRIKKNYTLFY